MELGKMKLEGIFNEAVFLAPKAYALKNKEEEVIKIRGLNKKDIKENKISFNTIVEALHKVHKTIFNQSKWIKNLIKGNISIREQLYTLRISSSKRKPIYSNNGKFITTVPYLLDNSKLLD